YKMIANRRQLLMIRHGVQGEVGVGVVLVEVLSDLRRDDFYELAFKLLHWLVGGGDAAVARELDLAKTAFPDQLVAVFHVEDGDIDVGGALVERLVQMETEVVELDVDDAGRLHGAAEVFEVFPVLLVDP